VDELSQESHRTLLVFFQEIVDSIRSNEPAKALQLLMHLREL